MSLKFPAPYFGGKSMIAEIVWLALGQPATYIEPFFGSGAVLLARQNYNPSLSQTETVCDKDGFIANVWRSLQFAPDDTAKWCDWPVNHADLNARRKTLLKNEEKLLINLEADDTWCDPKIAGYWIWAASCWIGSGLTRPNAIPHISHCTGVHAIGQRPHISNCTGVHEPYNTNLYAWFRSLSERLRYVRVVCGDWTRVCGGNWQDKQGDVGIFFDPPYAVESRDQGIYHHDSILVAKDVEKWCLPRGKKSSYRIVCAGYTGEYDTLIAAGWRVYNWTAQGGYSNQGGENENRKREILVLSPYCQLEIQESLF
jgi:site-specific DNA-adenine methylase